MYEMHFLKIIYFLFIPFLKQSHSYIYINKKIGMFNETYISDDND